MTNLVFSFDSEDFTSSYAADGIRYFIMVAFAGCIWPMTFGWFTRLGRR